MVDPKDWDNYAARNEEALDLVDRIKFRPLIVGLVRERFFDCLVVAKELHRSKDPMTAVAMAQARGMRDALTVMAEHLIKKEA
jgi:hypothetical protein